jgi:hypothetical protein
MKRLLFAGVLLSAVGLSRADEGRFQVASGYIPSGSAESSKNVQTPVMIKVDGETGETWRLVISGSNYWWLPVKNGVIPGKKAAAPEEKMEEEDGAPKAN